MNEEVDERIKAIALCLKKMRQDKNVSAETFAYDNNLSRVSYWNIEAGKRNLTLKSLFKILDCHNKTLYDVVEMMKEIEKENLV